MPITPSLTNDPGTFPQNIRYVLNGDPVNQLFLQKPVLDLEYRTEVLRLFVNAQETATSAAEAALTSFDLQHDHSGNFGEIVVDFARVYANSSPTDAIMNLTAAGQFAIKKSGGPLADDLFRLVEDGVADSDKIIFPGSAGLFTHRSAAASDLTANPHNLNLAGRVFTISLGCKVAQTADDLFAPLNPLLSVGAVYAAPGLVGKFPGSLTGTRLEGVVVGANNNALVSPQNIVLIQNSLTNDLMLSGGGEVIYGLLQNTGSIPSPTWVLNFYTKSGPYTFLQSDGSKTLKLYGQEAFSLTTVPTVDPRFITLCREGTKVL